MRVLIGCEESGAVRRAFRAMGHDAWSCDLLPARDGAEFHIGGDVLAAIRNGCPSSLAWVRNGGTRGDPWEAAVFFTPCTNLSGSGSRWLTDHWVRRNKCKSKHARADLFPCCGGNDEPAPGHCSDCVDAEPFTRVCPNGCRWHDGTEKRAAQKRDLDLFLRCFNSDIPRIAMENPVGMLSSLVRKPDQIIQPWQFGHGETKATCLWLKNLPPLKPTNIVEGREQRIWKMAPGENRQRDRSETYSGIAAAMASQWGAA